MSWVSLHNHSGYSILDSTIDAKTLPKIAKETNMQAIALTDSGNMFGAVEFYKACIAQDIKPILGCELMVAHSSRFEKKRKVNTPLAYPIILLVKNQIGYKNLCNLTSKAYIEGFYYYPRIDKELLKKHSEGLICLSGPVNSSLGYKILNSSQIEIDEEVNWFLDVFNKDYYFEMQLHSMSDDDIQNDAIQKEAWLYQKYNDLIQRQQKANNTLLELSNKFGVKCIATNDVHYAKRSDWKGHEILLNVASGEQSEIWERDSKGIPRYKVANPKRKAYPSHEYHFKTPEQMKNLFSKNPQALENSQEIVNKITFTFDFQAKHYPVFYPPNLSDNTNREKKVKEYLYKLCKRCN